MKKFIPKINKKSLQWQLLSRFFAILITSLVIIQSAQFLLMRDHLYKSKMQILLSRFHDEKIKSLFYLQTMDGIKQNSSDLIQQLIDVNMSVAIIDSTGNIIDSCGKVNISNMDEHDQHELHEKKVNLITPVPKLSNDKYIELLNSKENLEKSYKVIEDETDSCQLVIWRKIGPKDAPIGLIQLSTSVKDIDSMLHNQLYIYITSSILILFIGITVGGTVIKRTLLPLHNMTNTVEEINVGQLNTRLPENNEQLEIDKLSVSFNNMLERIETSFDKEQKTQEKMRSFVSDASHELKTPLTSIHGFVEILLRGAAKNEDQLNLALNSILLESDRLTKLVNDLLLLTKLDQKVSIDLVPEDINNVIKEVLPQLEVLCDKRKVNLQLHDDIKVNINRNQIKQVIFNLVQNAVRHTDPINGLVTISTNTENIASETYSVLRISDNGTGITPEHLDKIFDRFFRSETHRARKDGGYGLGLSIVKSIIDAHEGKINVESTVGAGTTFIIYLKIFDRQ
ncbi:sensor histidine kinase [Inconstantimicrobium mannanitabidum]|uniref:Two-component sensor histidine kinase n=1 Tax=Inconstantimicrobium mannanitabidum TaxID=1604901 RepID=A0ACB5RHN7_9CLOT|nr:HAMP domain-containing histidine kinase [Clostridium sp. TW13]GKX68586.1 two-component sensor histidine kinase [Clostridium sp. TW13]